MTEWLKAFSFYLLACVAACSIVALSGVALWWLAFVFTESVAWVVATIGVVAVLFSAALAFAETRGWD